MILEAKDLNYYYQDGEQRRYILKDTSVSFEKGKFYTILGQSGSGKTTLLSLLSALDSPHSGTILFNDQDIKQIGYENYRRNHVGIIFQSYNLILIFTSVGKVFIIKSFTNTEFTVD